MRFCIARAENDLAELYFELARDKANVYTKSVITVSLFDLMGTLGTISNIIS